MTELDDLSTFNAMTPALLYDMATLLSSIFAFKAVRALVLQAAGPHFCTGGRYDKRAVRSPLWWLKARGIYSFGYTLDRFRSTSVLSISLLHGSSIGGGLVLGLAADHRVVTQDAVFRLGVVTYGLSPIVMATRALPALFGSRFST